MKSNPTASGQAPSPRASFCASRRFASGRRPARRTLQPLRRAFAAALLCGAAGSVFLAAAPAHAAPIDALVKDAKFDDVKGVGKELADGLDPNSTDEHGTPILVLAAREKSGKVVALLVSNPKTNLNAEDRAGENALMMAALTGDVDIAKLLIDKGANVNRAGWSPLHYAATNGHDDVVTLLLAHAARVDAPSPNGTTPLMMAARGDYLSTIKLLLKNGANLNAQNQLGLNVLDFANRYHSPDAIKFLSARMKPSGSVATSGGQK